MLVGLGLTNLGRIYQTLLAGLLLGFILVNLAVALGPEIGFDALWYHLTIPKIYLEQQAIYHIPGGLLYYSEMPRLGEMLYLFALRTAGVVGTHFISWVAGIIAGFLTYLIARLYLERKPSWLAVFIFMVAPLVGWISSSAYVDLLRTDFELLALYFVLSRKYTLSGLALGLAFSVKSLALGSLLPVGALVFVLSRNIRVSLGFLGAFMVVALPWIMSSYLNTGHFIYPIGSGILDWHHDLILSNLNPLRFPLEIWKVFLYPEDPINPFVIIIAPWLFLNILHLIPKYNLLLLYGILSVVVWWLIPKTGGGRFILPYLPVLAILAVTTIQEIKDKLTVNFLYCAILILGVISLGSRLPTLWRLKNYLVGKESTENYLCRTLDPKTSVYVDCDRKVRELVGNNLVLVSDIHNLFYVDVPFVHETWYRGEDVQFVLAGNEVNASSGVLVYQNSQLGYKLFKL